MGITMNTTRHNIKFYKYILYHFIFSIIFTIFAMVICFEINIISHLFPSYYSCDNNIDELYKNDVSSVYGTATNLYYSGYDYIINNIVKAHYYYTLNNNTCTIYLISSNKLENPDIPPITIETLNFTANLESHNQQIKSLLNYMAADLKWNYDGLSKYTQSIFINEYNYHIEIYVIIAILTILGFVLSIVFGFIIILQASHIPRIYTKSKL